MSDRGSRVYWENFRGDKFAGEVVEIECNDLIVLCDDGRKRCVGVDSVVVVPWPEQ